MTAAETVAHLPGQVVRTQEKERSVTHTLEALEHYTAPADWRQLLTLTTLAFVGARGGADEGADADRGGTDESADARPGVVARGNGACNGEMVFVQF